MKLIKTITTSYDNCCKHDLAIISNMKRAYADKVVAVVTANYSVVEFQSDEDFENNTNDHMITSINFFADKSNCYHCINF